MRIVVVSNPNSGRGRAGRITAGFAAVLGGAGHTVETLPASSPGELERTLRNGPAALLVVIGGDGTVHHALPAAIAAGVPVYHVPLGTENLFSRQFGMDADPASLLRSLGAAPLSVDVGTCAGSPFAIMCSFGPDASVVHKLAAVRGASISHLSYARPILAELLSPSFPVLTVTADGRRLVDEEPGMLVVANSRQYALRIDPAVRASMTDGLLDVVFFPCRSRTRVVAWLGAARLRLHTRRPALRYATAAAVSVCSRHRALPGQIDGEPLNCGGEAEFGVSRGVLRVLSPAVSRPSTARPSRAAAEARC